MPRDTWPPDLVTRVVKHQVGEVGGQNAQEVDLGPPGGRVVAPQQRGVLHHDALVQVALVGPPYAIIFPRTIIFAPLPAPDDGVHDVDEVGGVVEHQPADGEEVLQLPEDGAPDHEDEVVEDSQVNDEQPGHEGSAILTSIHLESYYGFEVGDTVS